MAKIRGKTKFWGWVGLGAYESDPLNKNFVATRFLQVAETLLHIQVYELLNLWYVFTEKVNRSAELGSIRSVEGLPPFQNTFGRHCFLIYLRKA